MNPNAPTQDAGAPLLTPLLATPRGSASSSTSAQFLFPNAPTATLEVEHEVCLTWRDLSCVVETSDQHHPTRVAFRGVAGWVRGGEMLAVLGPRGCGKHTLLEVLACRRHSASRVEGTCLLNGDPYSRETLQRWGRYVAQDQPLLQRATVEETVRFAVRLHVATTPASSSSPSYRGATVEDTVDALLSLLCLQEVRHIRVDRLPTSVRGSGRHEATMCAVAVALASNPSLLFVEDPIRGLDAPAAMGVIASLCDVAASGVAVVITASQPPAGVFGLFNNVLLLSSSGEQAYFGEADKAVELFASLGVHAGSGSSPADFLISSVAAADEALQARVRQVAGHVTASRLLPPPTQGRDIAAGFAATRLRGVLQEVEDLIVACQPLPGPPRGACLACACRPFAQLFTVTRRTLVCLIRGSASSWASTLQFLLFVLVLGMLYFQVGLEQVSLPRRMVALLLIVAYTAFFASRSLEKVTTHDAAAYTRERRGGTYGATIYYLGVVLPHVWFVVLVSTVFNLVIYGVVGFQLHLQQFLVYCLVCALVALNSCGVRLLASALFTARPRLSSSSSSPSCTVAGWLTSLVLAVYLLPAARVLLFLPQPLPLWLRALELVSFLHHSLAAMVSNEFEGLVLNCTGYKEANSTCFATGQQYASDNGFDRADMWLFIAQAGVHAFIYLFVTYIVLCISLICKRRRHP